ncbi:MAG: killer suppression protein HigA [Candidatus Doudnabacteria bacterium]
MNIDFDNPKHERLVNDYEALSKRYNKKKGVDSASDILTTLDVLKAAITLADIPPSYRPHPLKGSYKGHFAVDVDKVHRVIFRPNHDGDSDYRIDNYKSIKNILIIEIFEDYH